jgi:hypothetical protein
MIDPYKNHQIKLFSYFAKRKLKKIIFKKLKINYYEESSKRIKKANIKIN